MITLNAYAKLNLSLEIVGKRQDGYHELDMIMQSISLYDTITIEKSEHIRVHMDNDAATEQNNTAYIAAQVFCKHTDMAGTNISIAKRIPSQAGLGGSSADAAAVLIGLDRLYNTQLGLETLMQLGKQIGADVPFSLFGGTARARGIGEKLERLHLGKSFYFVLVKPHQGVSTAQAFKQYKTGLHVRMESVQYALQKGDLALYHQFAGNVLGMAALTIAPEILKASNALMAAGAKKVLMTGSGSCMFAVFETAEQAQKTAAKVHGDFDLVGSFSTKSCGVKIIGDIYEPV